MDFTIFMAGLLFAAWFGWAGGNFATSFIYRLPRNEKCLGGLDPFCDICRTLLETRDKFPIFSWIINKGRCRFCDTHVTAVHTVVETLFMALFIMAFLEFGYGETMVLVTGLGAILITLAMIEYQHAYLDHRVMVALLVIAVAMRVLADGETLDAIIGAGIGGCIGFLIAQIFKNLRRDEKLSSSFIAFIAIIGTGLHWENNLLPVLAGGTLFALFTHRLRINHLLLPMTMGYGIFWVVAVMYPSLIVIPAR